MIGYSEFLRWVDDADDVGGRGDGGGAVGVGAAGTVVRSTNPNESSSRM